MKYLFWILPAFVGAAAAYLRKSRRPKDLAKDPWEQWFEIVGVGLIASFITRLLLFLSAISYVIGFKLLFRAH